jgi:hypothetical protein
VSNLGQHSKNMPISPRGGNSRDPIRHFSWRISPLVIRYADFKNVVNFQYGERVGMTKIK